jgi:hypothetical protein
MTLQFNVINYEVGVVSSGITFIRNLIKIRPTVLKLKHADRRTDIISAYVQFMNIVNTTHRNIKFSLSKSGRLN